MPGARFDVVLILESILKEILLDITIRSEVSYIDGIVDLEDIDVPVTVMYEYEERWNGDEYSPPEGGVAIYEVIDELGRDIFNTLTENQLDDLAFRIEESEFDIDYDSEY